MISIISRMEDFASFPYVYVKTVIAKISVKSDNKDSTAKSKSRTMHELLKGTL